jgi:hypothetical protein
VSEHKHVDDPLVTAPSHETVPTKRSWPFVIVSLLACGGVAFGAWKLLQGSKTAVSREADVRARDALGSSAKRAPTRQ